MGDHATNIAENIVFMIRGEAPTDRRPMGDDSSVTLVRPQDRRPDPTSGANS